MDHNKLIDVLEHAAQIEQAPNLNAVVSTLRDCLEGFGFTAALMMSLPHQRVSGWHEHVLVNEWPQPWYLRYTAACHYRHDPCATRCLISADPFVWSTVGEDTLDAAARLVMDEAREFGLCDGLCVPIHAPLTPPAAVTVAGKSIDLAPEAVSSVHVLAIHAHRAVKRILSDGSTGAAPRLTGREREVLQWTAAGKTAWEASRILSISESTVNTHLRSAKRKLDTANIVHAVVEALRRHEIHL